MEHYIFKQLDFVRGNTIRLLENIDDNTSEIIPARFNNHIKWNAGHIYLVQERFAFYFIGKEMILPKEFQALFSPGTKPAEWSLPIPSMSDLTSLLKEQVERIERELPLYLSEKLSQPYTTSTGLTLSSVEELLSFCLYHEGMHFATIKALKQVVTQI